MTVSPRMDTDPTGYASDIAVDLSLEFFPPRCKTRLNPLFALVDSKERLRIIQRVFDSKTCLYNVSLYFRFARFRQEAFFVRFSVEFVLQPPKLWLGSRRADARASTDNYALCGCLTAIFMGWDARCVCPYRLVRSFYDRSRKIIMPTLHPGECFWALRPTTMLSLLS